MTIFGLEIWHIALIAAAALVTQTIGGIATAIEGGFFERSRVLLTLEEFTRLRWMIVQAKERLDEIK